MNRTAMIMLVCLTAYGLLDLAVSALVAIIWRTRAVAPANLPPAVRARRILLLRLTPVAIATAITVFIVAPAFALFEPVQESEAFGPVIAALAATGLIQIVSSAANAALSLWMTRRIEREWLRSATSLDAPHGLRAFVAEDAPPVIALVGVFSPKLIAARRVIDLCTSEELASIVAHERGHFTARDNFKRWMMASLPDWLRYTTIHDDIIDAWHLAAEDAADDEATQGEPEARADLAALLLKVVRIAPPAIRAIAVVSPFVERDGLERRVRRLLQPELEPPAPLALGPVIGLAAIVVVTVLTVSSPAMMRAIFEAFEHLVAFGR